MAAFSTCVLICLTCGSGCGSGARAEVLRHYIRGPRQGDTQVFASNLPTLPDNIRPSPRGTFWVRCTAVCACFRFASLLAVSDAVHVCGFSPSPSVMQIGGSSKRSQPFMLPQVLAPYPRLRKALLAIMPYRFILNLVCMCACAASSHAPRLCLHPFTPDVTTCKSPLSGAVVWRDDRGRRDWQHCSHLAGTTQCEKERRRGLRVFGMGVRLQYLICVVSLGAGSFWSHSVAV